MATMNEQAEWAERNKVAMRRITPTRSAELSRYVLEGPYKRGEREPTPGAPDSGNQRFDS